MQGKHIVAPKYVEYEGSLVFLAGPIQGAFRWQDMAVAMLSSICPEISIANPRRSQDRKKGKFTEKMYGEQVDWETFYLREAAKKGVVMFWLAKEHELVPGRAYAQTSRFELGEWKVRHEVYGSKVVVGIDKGFSNDRYIKRRLGQDCPDIPICSDLRETCEEVIKLTKGVNSNGT